MVANRRKGSKEKKIETIEKECKKKEEKIPRRMKATRIFRPGFDLSLSLE